MKRAALFAALPLAALLSGPTPSLAWSNAEGFWNDTGRGWSYQRPLRRALRSPTLPASRKSERIAIPSAAPKGLLHIIVSIDKQRATLFDDGLPVASTAISSGTPGHPTPMGVFTVIQKDRHHISNLYDAPMPYMQRITWSGSALHEGPLPGYPASHGCVRLTSNFAQLLWRTTKLGARVIITRPEVAPVGIEHARLFVPKPMVVAEPALTSAIKTADAGAAPPIEAKPDAAAAPPPITTDGLPATLPAAAAKPAKAKPVSVFVSLKERKLYVRQGWQPLFDAPISFDHPEQPIGTHVYTAMGAKAGDAGLRWTVVSIPSDTRRLGEIKAAAHSGKARPAKHAEIGPPMPGASAALDRLVLPPQLVERISSLVTVGSSLIVSDNALSDETDSDTDFIVLTR